MTMTCTVTGYYQDGECKHCGRELKHCIVTDVGVFGAACFANKVTERRIHAGKGYRLSPSAVKDLAKMARNPARFGLGPEHTTFVLAGGA